MRTPLQSSGARWPCIGNSGAVLLEPVYQEALAVEFQHQGVPFQRELALPVRYRGQQLNTQYRVDFLCFGIVLVELKALGKVVAVERSQVLNYLKASDLSTALLLNFGAPSLQQERLVSSAKRPGHPARKSVKSA